MTKIEWIEPWEPIESDASDLVLELSKEVSPEHILYNQEVIALAHRIDCDDVLFQMSDGTFAVVHLTWSGKQDHHPNFPWTEKYASIDEFINKVLIPDAEEYGSIS
jgi:hypothetical protein